MLEKSLPALRAAVLVLAGLLPGIAQAQIYGTAARVNGSEISNERLERHFDEYVANKGRNITKMINPSVYKKLKREALDELIDREVLWQEAQRRGAKVGDEEVDAALKQFRATFKSEDAYRRKLERAGFDEKGYREYVRQELAINRMIPSLVETPKVSEEEIEQFYRDNPKRFVRADSARARHILVKVDKDADAAAKAAALKRAQDLLADARAGKDFADLAQRYSEDSATRGSGGDLGTFGRGAMVKPFEDAAFALKPGQISEVVETPFGYHVIKLEEYQPAGQVPLAEVKDRVRDFLAYGKRQDAIKAEVTKLRALAKIEVLVALQDTPK